jgi:hypothetical protein
MDMFDQNKTKNNMKLHVKKVLITDNCKDLYPEYFNFQYKIFHYYFDTNEKKLGNQNPFVPQLEKIAEQVAKIENTVYGNDPGAGFQGGNISDGDSGFRG